MVAWLTADEGFLVDVEGVVLGRTSAVGEHGARRRLDGLEHACAA